MNPVLELKQEVKVLINGVEVTTRVIGRRDDSVLENEQERVYTYYTVEADKMNLYQASDFIAAENKSEKPSMINGKK